MGVMGLAHIHVWMLRKGKKRKENGTLGVILEFFIFGLFENNFYSFVFFLLGLINWADLSSFFFVFLWMTENCVEVGIAQ